MDRASDFGSEWREFESLRGHSTTTIEWIKMLAVIVYIVLVIIGMFIMVKSLEAHNWKSYRTPSDDYPVTNALFTSLVISAMYA